MRPVTLGVIIGNRGFFPDHLVTEARDEITRFLKKKNPRRNLDGETKSSSFWIMGRAVCLRLLLRPN